jgi:hypothetical protein
MDAENNKYYLSYSSIDKDFFDTYIKHHIQKNLHKKCMNILDNEEFIECYSVGIKSERVACYSELWFLDINLKPGLYLPVFISDINTSSCYALYRCNMDNDNESINEDNYKSINELVDMCPKSTKELVNKILNNKI